MNKLFLILLLDNLMIDLSLDKYSVYFPKELTDSKFFNFVTLCPR